MTALQQGLVQPDSVIDTHPYTLDGHRIRDVGYYPELTMTGILQKSSDTGVSRLSLAMPVQHLIDTYRNFGFGTNTGLGLTGESAGLLPNRKYWSQLDRATFAFGYGLMARLRHDWRLRARATSLDYAYRSTRYRAPRHAGRDCARGGAHDGERCAARRRGR